MSYCQESEFIAKRELAMRALHSMLLKLEERERKGTITPEQLKVNRDSIGHLISFYNMKCEEFQPHDAERKMYEAGRKAGIKETEIKYGSRYDRTMMDKESIRRISNDQARSKWDDHY
jgi:hypothetical protein